MLADRTFAGGDTASNTFLPFAVGQGYQSLLFQFSYEPKFLEDEKTAMELLKESLAKYGAWAEDRPDLKACLPLQNLLTLSVFAPDGYLGCAHRQAPRQKHLIGGLSASRGFLPHPVTEGIWKAVINVHCVVTDSCNCRLRICALREGETA